MSYFMRTGDKFTPTAGRDAYLEQLPAGNYVVEQDPMGSLFFRKSDPFSLPGKVYGNAQSRVERIMNTFADRERSTGVLLSGEKGSGKSQLARSIALAGLEVGIPTILVNNSFCGDAFNALLASVEQPAIVIMDEFEKVYSETRDQEQVLTLLDGMMTSKKLFVLTVNDRHRVNRHMLNRPGRIYYSLNFTGLDADFIREYCVDVLVDQGQVENVVRLGALFEAFNFDMLKAVVEEMNRYDEDAFAAIEMLNARPAEPAAGAAYEVVFTHSNGLTSSKAEGWVPPLGDRHSSAGHVKFVPQAIGSKSAEEVGEEMGLDSDGELWVSVEMSHLRDMDTERGSFVFQVGDVTVSFTRLPTVVHDLRGFLSAA